MRENEGPTIFRVEVLAVQVQDYLVCFEQAMGMFQTHDNQIGLMPHSSLKS